ncbi:hypothetical protein LAU_0309 [Lausannevirus]|uniref:Uncharacterized protein n=1 Tax=Lausannevirus TaxID=999883 RepID=F2WLN7_9VIRU|nr:hypothetical protein LAU_0309 [Lausannevirus]AEA07160.1 hypothetical protein LAU_0309 [Lausannevirus]
MNEGGILYFFFCFKRKKFVRPWSNELQDPHWCGLPLALVCRDLDASQKRRLKE